jgi:hypothetical protein
MIFTYIRKATNSIILIREILGPFYNKPFQLVSLVVAIGSKVKIMGKSRVKKMLIFGLYPSELNKHLKKQ